MNRMIQKCIWFLAIPCILLGAGYCALMYYYKINIPYGTWVNALYCTGMTYEEVADHLLSQDDTVVEIDVIAKEATYHLVPKQDVYRISYKEGLDKEIASYGAVGLFTEKYITYKPKLTILSEKWEAYLDTLELFQKEKAHMQISPRLQIIEGENGFELIDGLEDSLDVSKASKVIAEAIEAGKEQVSLVETGCYYTPDYSMQDREVVAEFRALEDFCKKMRLELTIQGKTVYTIDWSVLKDWILLDEKGDYIYSKGIDLVLDEKKVREYAIKIEDAYPDRILKTESLVQAILKAFEHGTYGSYELEFLSFPSASRK